MLYNNEKGRIWVNKGFCFWYKLTGVILDKGQLNGLVL